MSSAPQRREEFTLQELSEILYADEFFGRDKRTHSWDILRSYEIIRTNLCF